MQISDPTAWNDELMWGAAPKLKEDTWMLAEFKQIL